MGIYRQLIDICSEDGRPVRLFAEEYHVTGSKTVYPLNVDNEEYILYDEPYRYKCIVDYDTYSKLSSQPFIRFVDNYMFCDSEYGTIYIRREIDHAK